MNTFNRLQVLKAIYTIYDEVVADWDPACRAACSICCTADVTATTIEAYLILEETADRREEWFRRIAMMDAEGRFRPAFTINHLAELCRRNQELPPETPPSGTSRCPFLDETQQCLIYVVRPFGCRSMFSRRDCRHQGHADMDERWMAVNELFMQYIEHIDVHGGTGNLLDVLMFFSDPARQQAYQHSQQIARRPNGLFNELLSNQPITCLPSVIACGKMLEPVVERLNRINIAPPAV